MEISSLKKFRIEIKEVLKNQKWEKYEHHLPDIQLQINNQMNIGGKQVILKIPRPGRVCAFKSKDNYFERAVILEMEKGR